MVKLSEITRIPQQPYKTANVEGHKLLYQQFANDFFFVIVVDNEMVAFAKAVQILQPKALVINRTFVVPKWRNRGFITSLHRTLRGNGNSIISDVELSPESISIWKKLSQYYSVKVIDALTGEIKRDSKLADFELANSSNERLMLEQYRLFGKPVTECGYGLLRETSIFLGTDCP
jgi:hypothetical protein